MNRLQKISKQPNYDVEASAFSKFIMFIFFISYIYLVFFEGGDPSGWIKATFFFFVGLFISGVLIAMPLFLLKKIFPKFSILINLLAIIITFLITRFFFLWLLA